METSTKRQKNSKEKSDESMTETPSSLFHKELLDLCEKHNLCAVPTYGGKVSAHDSMHIIPLNDFWANYLRNNCYSPEQ